jgi:hypothetical protein
MSNYRGKYPNKIKTVCSFLRKNGEPFASLCIETNAGAVYRVDAIHRDIPMPRTGQDITDWLLYLEPMNIDAQLLIKATFKE